MFKKLGLAVLAGLVLLSGGNTAPVQPGKGKIRVLIIDGQNNHDWRSTTPVMKKALEGNPLFSVEVATTPDRPKSPGQPKPPVKPKSDDAKELKKYEADLAKYKIALEAYPAALAKYKESSSLYLLAMSKFNPDFSKCDVVLSNYNGDSWSKTVQENLEQFLKEGKIALVIVHAANNSFGGWNEYRQMIGMGWYAANTGDRLLLDDKGEKVIIPKGKGDGPGHRYSGPFQVTVRDTDHPVTKGMPMEWKHNNDELYDNMRGPIQNIRLLATAYSKGTKVHEPMIWTISYGKGRVFHTPMGHDVNGMRCVGFQTTLLRGTEWAATGNVTIPIPADFPTADKISTIPAAKK